MIIIQVYMGYESDRVKLVEFGRLLYVNGFIAGTDGNLSVRVEKDLILITAAGVAKGFLKTDDLISVNPSGEVLSGSKRPSSEILMHLYVYNRRPLVGACCHAHPPYATAHAASGVSLPADVLPEAIITLGEIPLTEYASAGTSAVAESLAPFIENHNAFLLGNHGVLTIGRSLEEAYNRMETVEHLAKITYIARHIGNVRHLDQSEIQRLERIREALFGEM
jgi:L-fuculose-phosphate aldolase